MNVQFKIAITALMIHFICVMLIRYNEEPQDKTSYVLENTVAILAVLTLAVTVVGFIWGVWML